MDYVKNALG